ncbi:glycosyltransferase family 2 protein [Kangiella marina]|uniref:Glycosyltransferase family 2 protein n=1 Tax=Kangiella marina TaxID=1079178 RepID=A0ABP8IKB6_9GAMM
MEPIPISVFIIAQDEEQHIGRVLDSCQSFAEIIVVDSGSNDKTIAIAKSKGAKVVHHDWQGYAKQKQYAMSLCQHDWVLNLDADEELTPEIIDEFKSFVTRQHDYVALKCRRNDLFAGRFFSNLTRLPTNTRLFLKQHAKYRLQDNVHEGPDFDQKVAHTKRYFNHYGYSNIAQLTEKYNQYSSLKAIEKFNKGKKASVLKLLLIYPLEFIRNYLIYRYCFSGLRGFIFSHLSAYYALLKEAKLYELSKTS